MKIAAPGETVLETIGDFAVLSKLGQGGMGAVYRARQTSLGRIVALKVLPAQFEDDAEFISRFQREARVAASLQHANLVRVYSAGQAEGCHYMAMELIEGENLHQRMRRERLSMDEALRVAAEVARGLQFGWEKAQLVHRDIKPSNIYLSHAGEVKVGDLGLAKSLNGNTTGLTQTGTMMGTPHYMSPEQCRGDRNLDFRADIYSLGCTLYEMLTGQPPYPGTDPINVARMHLDAPLPAILKVLPGAPMPLVRLVGKMLKKQARERHQTYDDLIAELEYVREQIGAGTTQTAPSQLAEAWKQIGDAPTPNRPASPRTSAVATSNSKLPLYAAITAAVVVLGAGAWWLTSSGKKTVRTAGPARPAPAAPPAASNAPIPADGRSAPPARTWQNLLAAPGWPEAAKLVEGVRLLPKTQGFGVTFPGSLRDGALRARVRWTAVVGQQFQLGLRQSPSQMVIFSFSKKQSGGAWVKVGGFDRNKNADSWADNPQWSKSPHIGGESLLELRTIGSEVKAFIDGELITTVHDPAPAAGPLYFYYRGDQETQITALELLNVDGLSEAEARRLLDQAPLSSSSVSAAPSAPTSTASPAATPRDWLVSKTANVPPPADALEFGGSKYKLIEKGGKPAWEACKAEAEALGGHLVTVTSQEEHEWLQRTFGARLGGGSPQIWMGASRAEESAPWRWVTGEPFAKTFWISRQPTKAGQLLTFIRSSAEGIGWNAIPADPSKFVAHNIRGFLVEWDRFSAADAAANDPTKWRDLLAEARSHGNYYNNIGPDGFRVENSGTWDPREPNFADGAVRMLFRTGGALSGALLGIRGSSTSDGLVMQYTAHISGDRMTLRRTVFDAKARRTMDGVDLAAAVPMRVLSDSQPTHVLELRAIGDVILTYLDGQVMMSARDSTLSSGGVHVQLNGAGLAPQVSAITFTSGNAATKAGANTAAEPWRDLLHDKTALTINRGTVTSECLRFDGNGSVWLNRAAPRDGAIRLRAIAADRVPKMTLRSDPHLGAYGLTVSRTGDKVRLERWDESTRQPGKFKIPTLTRGLQPGDEYELELRAVGDTIIAKLNGETVATLSDGTYTTGRMGISFDEGTGSLLVKSIELLDLDAPAAPGGEAAPRVPGEGGTAPSGAAQAATHSTATATKDAPFVNSLGMKFVPVPITGGPTGGKRVLFSIWETRMQDYDVFVKESGREWPREGLNNQPNNPAANVTWDDAQAFCQWLTQRERKSETIAPTERFRLPTSHEWSCAVGIGDQEDAGKPPSVKVKKVAGIYPWGTQWPPPPGAGNYKGEENPASPGPSVQAPISGYRDGFTGPSPVGRFTPNAFGLYDLGGNVWERCEDSFDGRGENRVSRGQSYADADRDHLLASNAGSTPPDRRFPNQGFRVVLAPAE